MTQFGPMRRNRTSALLKERGGPRIKSHVSFPSFYECRHVKMRQLGQKQPSCGQVNQHLREAKQGWKDLSPQRATGILNQPWGTVKQKLNVLMV